MLRGFSAMIAVALFLGLLAASAFAVQFLFFRPVSIDAFFTRSFLQFALEDPEELTRLRVLEPYGLDFHNDDLTDVSPDQARRMLELQRRTLDTLEQYDRAMLSPEQQISWDVLHWELSTAVEGERWLFHDFPVNQLFGVHVALPTFMMSAHRINTLDDARNYIIRLSRFEDKFRQTLESLRQRENLGVLPPRFLVDKVLQQLHQFVRPEPANNPLVTTLAERIDRLHGVPEGLRGAMIDDASFEVERVVYPAYREMIRYFDSLRFKATGENGVWSLPGGKDYYDWLVRKHTTLDVPAERIHRLGVQEVKRIETEMARILDSQGYFDGTVAERINKLAAEPRFRYRNTAKGRQRILAEYQRLIDEAASRLRPLFRSWPSAGVEVRRVPEFSEREAPSAYYESPPLDGSRPGVFYVNLRNADEIPRFAMRTLAYHEAIPGHHLQLGIQQELPHIPLIRKTLPVTAFVEGWALYAERLAHEAGLQSDPFDNLGRLQDELFRAVRLVVDTGIHHRRWSRNEAIAYMSAITGRSKGDIIAEVDRYMVLPGQALAYTIGMVRLLELRDYAENQLGGRFSLHSYHEAVLRNGAIPLPVLRKQIDAFVAERG